MNKTTLLWIALVAVICWGAAGYFIVQGRQLPKYGLEPVLSDYAPSPAYTSEVQVAPPESVQPATSFD